MDELDSGVKYQENMFRCKQDGDCVKGWLAVVASDANCHENFVLHQFISGDNAHDGLLYALGAHLTHPGDAHLPTAWINYRPA